MTYYAIYRIRRKGNEDNTLYASNGGLGFSVNDAYLLASQWNEEDAHRGDQYEVRELVGK